MSVLASFMSRGERIIIRLVCLEDHDVMWENMNGLVAEKAPIARQKVRAGKDKEEGLKKWKEALESGKSVTVVALASGKIIGHASVGVNKAEEVELGIIMLIPGYRGRQIAQKMLDIVLKKAKKELGAKKVVLHAFAFNEPALGLYRRFGFVDTGVPQESREYYGELRDRVEMVKNLDESLH